ncbi:MAG: hypothetical protein ACI9S8_000313 [Chlamydiales bacterium]|jgi:hypothetical protein
MSWNFDVIRGQLTNGIDVSVEGFRGGKVPVEDPSDENSKEELIIDPEVNTNLQSIFSINAEMAASVQKRSLV